MSNMVNKTTGVPKSGQVTFASGSTDISLGNTASAVTIPSTYTIYGGSGSYGWEVTSPKREVSLVNRLNIIERMLDAGIGNKRIRKIYNLIKSEDEVSQELGMSVAEEMIKEYLNIEKYASKQEQKEALPEEEGSASETNG